MIETLIALITLVAFSMWGTNRKCNVFSEVICPVFCLIGFCGLLFYAFGAIHYFGAKYKADIINAEYGTSYTQDEVFYASSVIDSIRELDRKRIEINGDLITGK